jgi:hypothetical protein
MYLCICLLTVLSFLYDVIPFMFVSVFLSVLFRSFVRCMFGDVFVDVFVSVLKGVLFRYFLLSAGPPDLLINLRIFILSVEM